MAASFGHENRETRDCVTAIIKQKARSKVKLRNFSKLPHPMTFFSSKATPPELP